MAHFVYSALCLIFSGGAAADLSKWMQALFATVIRLCSGDLMTSVLGVFSALSCSMLLFWFYLDLVGQASRDLFSMEKLIVAFIKLLVACIILVSLKDIVIQTARAGRAAFFLVKAEAPDWFGGTADTLTLFPEITGSNRGGRTMTQMPAWTQTTKDLFEEEFGWMSIFTRFQTTFLCVLTTAVCFIAKLAGYFICTNHAVQFLARAVGSPIGVVQLFEDGTKSAGVRYLKKLAAEALSMACILLILFASSAVTQGMFAKMLTIDKLTIDTIAKVITYDNVAILLVPQLVSVGGMAAGSRLAHDLMGV